jgi:hypothetical protein
MKSVIIIIVNSNNTNVNYIGAVEHAKSSIREYLGAKYVKEDEPEVPCIKLSCEVTQDDINQLHHIIDNENIILVGMIADDDQTFEGDILDLRKF